MLDLDHFRLRLAETIAWCSRRLEYYSQPNAWGHFNGLRDPRLRPPTLEVRSREHNAEGERVISRVKEPHEIEAIVDTLAEQRALSLLDRHMVTKPIENLAGGRLLFYYPYDNLADGFSEIESEGFFNSENEPPWDTWVAFISEMTSEGNARYLVSWVPPQMLNHAEAGVHVNPEGCVVWTPYREGEFSTQLRDANLLPYLREQV